MKNRLLLAMSAFPSEFKENSFCKKSSNGIEEFLDLECYSQLEPIAKYLIHMHKMDELEIIVLCTKATYTEFSNKKPFEDISYTPFTFFMDRMNTYYGNKEEQDHFISVNTEHRFEIIKRNGLTFVRVHMDEENPKSGIEQVVKYIRDEKNVVDGQFWIDTHGGFRDVSLSINAIVSLLKVYDIKPNEIYGVRYTPIDPESKEKKPNEIVSQSQSYQMFDFVSGINEFENYGRIDTLREYYHKTSNNALNSILNAMIQVSDGLQMCDPVTYMNGLDQLGKAILSNDGILVNTGDAIFDIFLEYIKRDYGELLDQDKRTPLKVVKRCVQKKMYQQALTFIESLMPEQYINGGVLTCDFIRCRNDINSAKDKKNNRHTDNQHFVFDSHVNQIDFFEEEYANQIWNGLSHSEKRNTEKNEYRAIRMLKQCKGDISKIQSTLLPENELLFLYLKKGEPKIQSTENIAISVGTRISDVNKQAEAGRLLRLHKALKVNRNLVNHSSGKLRPKIHDLEMAIETYVEWAEKVLNHE